MITNIAIATVFVKDVDASRDFYTEICGFEVTSDITLADGYRWCTVHHPSQPELQVHLTLPGPPHSPEMVAAINRSLDGGGMHGLGMAVDDCRRTYEEFQAKGVEFLQEPSERPYGVEAVCRDNSGNWMVLVEQKAYSGEDFAHG